jgi:putative ABC transport system permease protein
MLAIGEGASYNAQEEIKTLGSQNIILRSVKPPEEQKVSDKGSQSYVLQYGLTYKDVKAIRATIPGVTVVLPARKIRELCLEHQPPRGLRGRGHGPVVSPKCAIIASPRADSSRTWTWTPKPAFACSVRNGGRRCSRWIRRSAKHVRVGGGYYQVIGVMEARGSGPATETEQPTPANRPATACLFPWKP